MKRWGGLLQVAVLVGFLLLYAPLLAVALYSFNAAEKGSVWVGFSLRWYAQLMADPETSRRAWEIREATLNTLQLGAVSTVISTILGTMLALGMQRFPWPSSLGKLLQVTIDVPVITPDIVIAAALVVGFNLLRFVSPLFDPGMSAMIIGHVTFQIAFVALVVRSRLVLMGPTLSEAARDLYASSWYHFHRVTLPLLWPAIVGGAMLAFTLSLDDFVISFFTCGPSSSTLPIYVYHSQLRGLRTDLFAVSTLLVMGTVVLVLTLERLTRWKRD
ncbi:ABC transporter permease [Chondromyces apiculatus]|uniref:Spermidine Putrescine ABC transporter permease component potC n=1 Tax=Chondromyces apiculatus DSM 436 TaxID=1192034 RepID=A0A017T9G8_9BACT|nr:ABC transporter permease [Chondromyces apiculatus]EYF05923.1 Spermidine Putrescine ABC transporter permease component potC [Chondromyces apiculatus DSM 436]